MLSPEHLEKFRGLSGMIEVRKAMLELCRPFGEVLRIEVEPDGGGGFVCLVDLATIGQNADLCRKLGGFSYGRGVGFLIPAGRG